MNEKLPYLRRPEDMPPIRSQSDLHQYWRALMGELGFSQPALWVQFLTSDDRSDGMLTHFEELTHLPEQPWLDELLVLCGRMLDSHLPGGRVVFLFSRPGSRRVTDNDRAWALAIMSATRKAGIASEPIHLANDEELRVFAPDDLASPRSAA